MKKASIRILALFMAIIMISGIVPYSLFTLRTGAAESQVQQKLSAIMADWGYGNKKFFNVRNSDTGKPAPCNHSPTSTCNKCSVHGIVKDRQKQYKDMEYSVSTYRQGNTCFSLCSYCYTKIFGETWAKKKTYDSDTIVGKHKNFAKATDAKKKEFFNQAKVGDIIGEYTYDKNKKEYSQHHWMVVTKVNKNKSVEIYECNYGVDTDGKKTGYLNKRSINMTSGFKYYNYEIYHAPNYDEVASTAIMPRISEYEKFMERDPETNKIISGVRIKLACDTPGAIIYYTVNADDSAVNKSSEIYTGEYIELRTKSSTIRARAYKDGFNRSKKLTAEITIDKTPKPIIGTPQKLDYGYKVTINRGKYSSGKNDTNSRIYYTTDGTDPSTNGKKYTEPFEVLDSTVVRAVAAKKGQRVSSEATQEIVLSSQQKINALTVKVNRFVSAAYDAVYGRQKPRTDGVNQETNICGIGDGIDLSWKSVDFASEYIVSIYKDGTLKDKTSTESCLFKYIPEESGEFRFDVQSITPSGESEVGDATATVTVKPNVSVTFSDNDGKVIEVQQVKYGGNAEPPVHPNKEGYNWKNWNGKYTEVTEDSTVTAVYTPLQCTIKFEDESGTTLSSATVNYGGSYPNVPSAPTKQGFNFVDWSKKSGEGDSYTNVNGSAVFEPVYKKNNADLPLTVTVSSAVRSDDAKRYTVSTKISNSSAQTVDGKIIAVIKTANDKVVAIEQKTVSVAASAANQAESLVINSTSDAMKCEVYVVGVDTENSNKTGGTLSEKATASVTRTSSTSYSYWSGWSDWSETPATASSTKEVEAKEQIRTRSKETTTGTSPELDGWTQTGTNTEYGAWSSWSSWSETKQTASETKAVETRKVYRYFHYCVGDGAATIAPSTAYAYGKKGPHYQYYTSKRSVDQKVTVGGKSYECAWCGACQYGCKYYFYDKQVTQYRYRTRTATTTYNFERWTDWSNWSDTGFTVSQGVENSETAEYRMLYRYRNLLTGTSSGSTQYIVNEETSGTPYTLSGNLSSLGTDYAGKYATVMVYKGGNTDPTEAQIEYIGQIKLGTNNSYSFTFIPREEISMSTGNYIVSMGIAGTTRLINNVDTIEAPWKYKVTFYDLNGSVIKEDYVSKGEDAVAPALPEAEGMRVTWDKSLNNIIGDMNVYPETENLQCTVFYVDWANSKVLKTETVDYGTKVNLPASPVAEGKIFKNWQVDGEEIDAEYTVTGITTVEANYENIVNTVSFLNKDGSVFASQEIPYGSYADLPEENPVAEGFEFVAWDSETEWWNVKEDIEIQPVFVFEKTVETPIIKDNFNLGIGFISLETTTEDAVIHYTTDGSEPTEEDLVFDDVIWVEEKTIVRAKAFKPGMNPSDTAETTIEVVSESDMPKISAVTNTSQYVIGDNYAKLCMKIENPLGFTIKSYGYHLENKITGETSEYENTSVAGSTDKVIGKVFTVSNLKTNSVYVYDFFVNFEIDGEDYYIDSQPCNTDAEVTSFTLGTVKEESDYSNVKLSINKPSTTTINYGYTLILHTTIENLPEGTHIVWSFDGTSFKGDGDNEKCSVYVENSGDTTVKATVCDKDGKPVLDENGKEISSSVKLTAKAGFFQKLIAFFKNLFRVNMVIDG